LKLATGAWADALGATIGVDMGVGTSVAAAGVPVAPNTAGAVVEVDALHAPNQDTNERYGRDATQPAGRRPVDRRGASFGLVTAGKEATRPSLHATSPLIST